MEMIHVIHPGIYCTIQDKGRFGFAKMGIPQAGFLDSYAATMANILLKNRKDSAVIEITFGQGKFEFTSDTFIVLMGGNFSPKLNTFSVEMNSVHEVKKGTILTFGRRLYGARTYLAVQGGIQSDSVFKSKSYFSGITRPRLIKGDLLPILPAKPYLDKAFSKIREFHEHFSSLDLPCFAGPEFDLLTEVQKEQLLETFTVSEDNNRVGYRLHEVLENELEPILTSAVLPGTVQLTPSGKLIILMRDCQVTGGYPRILQLSDYAISRLSQKVAGDQVKFELMN